MAKAPTDIRSLARRHTPKAIETLAGIMNSQHSSDDAKIRAANSLIDRGWGKPAQPQTGEDGEGPVQIIVQTGVPRAGSKD